MTPKDHSMKRNPEISAFSLFLISCAEIKWQIKRAKAQDACNNKYC